MVAPTGQQQQHSLFLQTIQNERKIDKQQLYLLPLRRCKEETINWIKRFARETKLKQERQYNIGSKIQSKEVAKNGQHFVITNNDTQQTPRPTIKQDSQPTTPNLRNILTITSGRYRIPHNKKDKETIGLAGLLDISQYLYQLESNMG